MFRYTLEEARLAAIDWSAPDEVVSNDGNPIPVGLALPGVSFVT